MDAMNESEKIIVDLEQRDLDGEAYPPYQVEHLFASKVGNHYQVDSVPFFATGISYRDLIEAHPGPAGLLKFNRVAKKSGHMTYRVLLTENAAARESADYILKLLADAGCTLERGFGLIAIDIPPGEDASSIVGMIQSSAAEGVWQYEAADSHLESPFG